MSGSRAPTNTHIPHGLLQLLPITFSSLQRVCLSLSGGFIHKNHPCGELKKASVLSWQ